MQCCIYHFIALAICQSTCIPFLVIVDPDDDSLVACVRVVLTVVLVLILIELMNVWIVPMNSLHMKSS